MTTLVGFIEVSSMGAVTDCSIVVTEYVSPNAVRHALRRKKGDRFDDRSRQKEALEGKRSALQLPEDELSNRRVFG